jgi:hypothetical protein
MTPLDWNDRLRDGGVDSVRAAFDEAVKAGERPADEARQQHDDHQREEEKPGGPKKRERLAPIAWSDIGQLPKRRSLIRGLLDSTAITLIYGAANCGKTFVALDIALRVALGMAWRGRKIVQGGVVYIAAEGGLGIAERLVAFRLKHHIAVEGVPFFVIPEQIDLCRSDTDIDLLLQRLAELAEKRSIELIVVDTLSRAFGGGNENSPDDMGRFVHHCDAIRMATGAHVLIVHHTGKDDARGARGHSLLRAAVDTEIEVTKTGEGCGVATVTKQRDRVGGEAFAFKLEPVIVGHDEDGLPVTSCVVVEAEAPTEQADRRSGRPSRSAQIALRALKKAIDETGAPAPPSDHIPVGVSAITRATWRQHAYMLGVSTSDQPRARQQAFQRASADLIADGSVEVWGDLVWLP